MLQNMWIKQHFSRRECRRVSHVCPEQFPFETVDKRALPILFFTINMKERLLRGKMVIVKCYFLRLNLFSGFLTSYILPYQIS